MNSLGRFILKKRLVFPYGLHSACIRRAMTTSKCLMAKDKHSHFEVAPGDPKHGGSGDIFLIPGLEKRPPGPKTVEEFVDPNQKNWVSYGFNYTDQKEDRFAMHVVSFTCVTIFCVLFSWFAINYPDHTGYDWAQREAYLELYRREKLGLPLIDKNLVDPATVVLPTEEQIGNMEIYV